MYSYKWCIENTNPIGSTETIYDSIDVIDKISMKIKIMAIWQYKNILAVSFQTVARI